jgi:hypothetical protein
VADEARIRFLSDGWSERVLVDYFVENDRGSQNLLTRILIQFDIPPAFRSQLAENRLPLSIIAPGILQ